MGTIAPPGRLVLSRQEVAEATGLSTSTIDRAIANGDLPALKLGPGRRLVRVRREDVTNWLRSAQSEEKRHASP